MARSWSPQEINTLEGDWLTEESQLQYCRWLYKKPNSYSSPKHALASVYNLALVLQYQGKYEAAEEMHWRALKGREKVLGVKHPNTLTSVSNVASVLQNQRKYEAAEEMNRRALEGREKVLGAEHPATLTSVYHLAYVLHSKGQYDAASGLYQRAIAGYQKTLGSHHPTSLVCSRPYSTMVDQLNERRPGD
jgi:tetratricopeptide (TPR) repeat protein